MKPTASQPAYFDTLLRRRWTTAAGALAGALVLNLMLFAVMPYLLRPVDARPDFDQIVSAINVVRIKRPETPVRRQSPEPPPPPPPETRRRPEPVARQTLQPRLSLPFAVNPRLPALPGSLVVPDSMPAIGDNLVLGDTFAMTDLDGPLTVLARIPPVYPLHAKRRGVQGWVKVHFVVNENGRAEDITIVESQPPGVFDQSVTRCISGWRFQPGTIAGLAVKARAETTIRFELN